jgi:hypothetical protein
MSIGKIAGKYDLSVVARVASEGPDEEISVLKKRFKNMKAAMSAYNYMVNDHVDNPIIVALKSAGFFTTTFGSKNNPNEPVYIGMRIARTLGTNANVAVWKISGYVDGRTMVIAHATAQPESAIEEDYKSNGPITRALAAYHAAQAR